MSDNSSKILSQVKPTRVILPTIIGVAAGVYIAIKEGDEISLASMSFSWEMAGWFFMAIVMMLSRDIGYIIRLKILSDGELSWIQSIRVVFLWEFASSVTPTAIGGTSVALLFLYKENLSIGRGSTVVLSTSFLDELYFVIMLPLLVTIVGWDRVFGVAGADSIDLSNIWDNRYFLFAFFGYLIKLLYVILIGYGLFFNPVVIKRALLFIFRLPFIRRWKSKIESIGDELINASKELRHKPYLFWIKTFFATAYSWTSRYWVANFVILGVVAGLSVGEEHSSIYGVGEQALIFVSQLVMWIMMMVMPSPGGSGFSEMIFVDYMEPFIPLGFVAVVALLWRLISYYPYLIVGAVILPNWVRTKFIKRDK